MLQKIKSAVVNSFNKPGFTKIMLLDLLFFMILTGILKLWNTAAQKITTAFNAPSTLTNTQMVGQTTEALAGAYQQLLWLTILIVIIIIAVFSVFQAYTWTIATRKKIKKQQLLHTLKNSLLWWTIIILAWTIYMIVVSTKDIRILNYGLIVFGLLTIYFSTILYYQITKKTTGIKEVIETGIKKAPRILLTWMPIVLLFLILNTVDLALQGLPPILYIITSICLLLWFLAWFRIVVTTMYKKLKI